MPRRIFRFEMSLKKSAIINIINAFAALFVMALFLYMVRDVISTSMPPPKKAVSKNSMSRQAVSKRMELMEYSQILKKNPFGFYGGELLGLASKSEGANISTDVTLVGTVSGNKKFAYAIFADKNNTQEVFKVGDSVFGLGKLKRVERNMVVINDKGKTKEIQITDIIAIKEANIPVQKSSASADSFSADKFAKKTTDTSYVLDGQKVQQALSNPNQIMTDARLLPNVTDGRQAGFVLREVRHGGIYHSLGLHDGDVLLKINEYNISNPEAALQAFTALKGLDRVQLDIIRGGANISMTYQIR